MSITLYHYTDANGVLGIRNSGKILMSRRSAGDAVAGNGVYLTDKAPHKFSEMQIANDIFRDATLPERMVKAGRLKFAFKVKIAKSKVEHVIPDRHVWLYRGKDLNIRGPDVQDFKLLQGPDKEHEDPQEQGFIEWFIGALVAQ